MTLHHGVSKLVRKYEAAGRLDLLRNSEPFELRRTALLNEPIQEGDKRTTQSDTRPACLEFMEVSASRLQVQCCGSPWQGAHRSSL